MRRLAFAIGLIVCAPAAWANAKITLLMDALQVDEAVQILRDEGFAYADTLEADMLNGEGGSFWDAQVRQIYDIDRITERVRQALESRLSQEDVDLAIAFFGSEAGTQITTLENAARRAMLDSAVETAARDVYASLRGTDDPLMRLVSAFVDANDLIDRNVSGSMNSYVQFYMGLSDGRFLEQTEDQILQEVWSQQEEIRENTDAWLHGFLLMAYQPVPLTDLEAYVAYSDTPAGQALNAALFEGFEYVYSDISYALGRAIALNADGDEI